MNMESVIEPTDTLSTALHILAGDVCLRVSGDYIPVCRPFSVLSDSINSKNSINSNNSNDSNNSNNSNRKGCIDSTIELTAPSTWLCKDAHFFTLFRPSCTVGTLLFSHTNEILYHASVEAQLSKDCPADLRFLCQFTTDSLPEGCVPRLLAFDVITPNTCPGIRGDMLRGMQVHLPQPLCVVQWIGPRQYLSQEFIARLPHKIRGLFALGSDPLVAGAFEALVTASPLR